MKKLVFFILFLTVCSMGVYAYFYWKAMQVKTPLVSVEIIIPKKQAPKTTPEAGRPNAVKKIEPKVQRTISEPQKAPQNTDVQKEQPTVKVEEQKSAVVQDASVVSDNTVKQEETKSKEETSQKVPEVQKDAVLPQETPVVETDKKEEVWDEKEVATDKKEEALSEKRPEPATLLIPTTEPIVKEDVPTSVTL